VVRALAGKTGGANRVCLDLFCYILSGVEGLYQDKKVKKNENHVPI